MSRGTALRACVLMLATVLAGCSLRQPAVVTESYALPLPSAKAGPSSSRSIAVLPFGIAPTAGGQMFLYRADEFRYESDYYNRFLAPPAQMLTEGLRRWLTQSRAGTVLEPGAPLSADVIVQPRLEALYADYRDMERPEAVFAMVATVIRRGGEQGNRVVFERSYRRAVPMREVSPQAAVEGWRQAAAAVFGEFTRDLRAVE